MKRKICVITGTRAEYGLLKPLIDELIKEKKIELILLVTGAHLSPEFGLTYKEIEKDGFVITEKIEILMSSDTSVGIAKAMGLAMISFSEAYQRLKPSLIVGLGDRFELFAAVSAALVSKIPVAHIHGGEITSGAYDDAFRHAITKMSHIHFTSTETYRNRVIQLGENPKTVFNVGALGIDNIKKLKLLSKVNLEKELKFKLDKPYFVVTFHPVTLEENTSEAQMNELFLALDEFPSYKIIFTKPNADNDSRIIIDMIDDYVGKHDDRAIAFQSLGQLRYLSLLKHSIMMIGNSSSGIIEMPYFRKPTINVGDRQKGRISSESVIQCDSIKVLIIDAIKKGISFTYLKDVIQSEYLYGNGNASKLITKEICSLHYSSLISKKFYDAYIV